MFCTWSVTKNGNRYMYNIPAIFLPKLICSRLQQYNNNDNKWHNDKEHHLETTE